MLPFGPLGPGTVHVAVDLQRIFAEDTAWQCTAIPAILPNVLKLAHAKPGRTVWTRFVVPHHADDAPGMWRDYYRHWDQFTGRNMEAGLVDLVPDLVPHAAPELVIDKLTYSAFEVPAGIYMLQWIEVTNSDLVEGDDARIDLFYPPDHLIFRDTLPRALEDAEIKRAAVWRLR